MSAGGPASPPVAPAPPVRAVDRLPLASWRLLVATVAVLGTGYAATRRDLWWQDADVQAALLAAVTGYALAVVGLARPATAWTWWRGAVATAVCLVGAVGAVAVDGGASGAADVVLHVVLPVLVAVDLVVVGVVVGVAGGVAVGAAGAPALPWWWVPTWLVLPVAYWLWYEAAGLTTYAALDRYDASYGRHLLGLALATLGVAAVLAGARNLLVRRRLSA